jgi:hypothetical protein
VARKDTPSDPPVIPEQGEAAGTPSEPEFSSAEGTSGPMVRWVGGAGERRIEAEDWDRKGIEADAVVWDHSNNRAIPKSEFTEDQLRVLSGEPGFVIEE